ncbi:MAG TPA: hypothetical protein VHI52_04900, partial [Verrucomicrobiae bacterium]|nr:hypothetical protein [Verrucomicrobiae bacterium]
LRIPMKSSLLFAASWVGLSLVFAGAAGAAETPSVDSILAKYVSASGGKPALEKITSRVVKIHIESEAFGTSDGEVYAAAPDKVASHIEMPNSGAIDEGFDGKVAWAKSPWQELREKAGEELAKARRDAQFYRVVNFKQVYPELVFKGTEKVGDEDAYLLESKPSATSSEKFWFGAKSGLVLRQDSAFDGPQGAVGVSVLAQGYKAIEGIQYPSAMKMKISAGGQTFEMTMKFLEVQHNVKIDPAKFAKPSA